MHKFLARYRYSYILLRQLVITDFKLRYQGSVLGYVWSLLRPLLLFVILYFVFSVFLKFGDKIEHYPVYLLLGIVLWSFFTEITTGSVAAIVGRGDLLRKLNFPKYVIVLAGSFSALINLCLNFIVVVVFMIFNGVSISWSALLVVPLVLELFALGMGLAFLLSALYVRFRDVTYIWEVLMQAAFYATPILYPLSEIHSQIVAKILMLNPVAQIIQDSRYLLVTKQTDTLSSLFPGRVYIVLLPFVAVVAVAVMSSVYFRKRSKYFAEEV